MSPIHTKPPAKSKKTQQQSKNGWKQNLNKYSHDRVITIYSKISVSILKYLFLDLLLQHSFMS